MKDRHKDVKKVLMIYFVSACNYHNLIFWILSLSSIEEDKKCVNSLDLGSDIIVSWINGY